MNEVDFGNCCECGTPLEPVWFKDIEFEPKSNIPTGRVKWAVNYLSCPCCLKKFTVDDSFDGDWFRE
jgi:hypothetical protein